MDLEAPSIPCRNSNAFTHQPGSRTECTEGKGGVGRQYLGRDAADVEAGASQGAPLLDAGGPEPQLRCLDRRHVPAGPAADNHHVGLLDRRVRPQRRRPGPRLRPPQQRIRRAPPRQARHRHPAGSSLRFLLFPLLYFSSVDFSLFGSV